MTGPTASQCTTPNSSGLETVTDALPANLAGDGKLFVRLNVVIAAE